MDDLIFYGMGLSIFVLGLFVFFVFAKLGNLLKVVIQNTVRGGRIAQIFRETGGFYWENQYYDEGFYEGPSGRWEACDYAITQGTDFPVILEHTKLGFTFTSNVAVAQAGLKQLGYHNIANALNTYFDNYLDLKTIEKDATLTPDGKQIKILSLKKKGLGDLIELRLEYATPFTMCLNQIANWGLVKREPLNQKNQLIKKELQVRQQMLNLQTTLLTPNNVLLFIMILMGGACAVAILTNGNVSIPNVLPTK